MWQGLWTPAHLASTKIDTPAVADPVDLSFVVGAGNYRSTPTDIIRFVLALNRSKNQTAIYSASPQPDTTQASRSSYGWIVRTYRGFTVAHVAGSVWTGSFAVISLPAKGIVVALASNVQFNQPVSLLDRLVDLALEASRTLPADRR